jgi:hypothetical protein
MRHIKRGGQLSGREAPHAPLGRRINAPNGKAAAEMIQRQQATGMIEPRFQFHDLRTRKPGSNGFRTGCATHRIADHRVDVAGEGGRHRNLVHRGCIVMTAAPEKTVVDSVSYATNPMVGHACLG